VGRDQLAPVDLGRGPEVSGRDGMYLVLALALLVLVLAFAALIVELIAVLARSTAGG
jgi:hypothetical protein